MNKQFTIILISCIVLFLTLINLHSNNSSNEEKKLTKIVVAPFVDLSENVNNNEQYRQLTNTIPNMIAGEYINCINLDFIPPNKTRDYLKNKNYPQKLTARKYEIESYYLKADVFIHGNFLIENNQLKITAWIYFDKGSKIIRIDEEGDIYKNFYQVQRAFIIKIGNVLGRKLDISKIQNNCGGFKKSLVILIDTSGSMKDDNKIEYAKKAVIEIINNISVNTETAILGFSGDHCHPDPLNVIHPFSNNVQALKLSLKSIYTVGGTPLSSAMEKAIDYLEANHRGKTGHIILLSDGQDDCRKIDETLKIVNKTIIPVELDSIGIDIRKESTAEFDLQTIAEQLNGNFYSIKTSKKINKELEPIIKKTNILKKDKLKSHPIFYLGY